MIKPSVNWTAGRQMYEKHCQPGLISGRIIEYPSSLVHLLSPWHKDVERKETALPLCLHVHDCTDHIV